MIVEVPYLSGSPHGYLINFRIIPCGNIHIINVLESNKQAE